MLTETPSRKESLAMDSKIMRNRRIAVPERTNVAFACDNTILAKLDAEAAKTDCSTSVILRKAAKFYVDSLTPNA